MTEPTARRTPLGALLGWTLFVGLVLYAVFLGGGWPGIYSTDLRLASLIIAVAGLAGWAVLAWRRPEWRPRSAIWPAIVAPLAGLTIATAASPWPRLGIEYLAWSVILAALYLLLVRILAQPFARARIGGLSGLLCLAIGALFVGLVVQAWIEWWGLVGYVTAPPLRPRFESLTFGNPSAVLTMTVLLLPPAVAAWGLGTPARVGAALGLVVLTALVALLTGSRAGWVAIAGAVGIVGLAWLLAPGHRGRLAAMLGDRRVRIGLVAVGLGLGAAALIVLPGILFRAGSGGENLRGQYIVSALRMFADAPVTGLGPGAWVARRIVYTEAGEPDYYIPHAHDVYAQTLAETGIVGAVAGLVAFAALGWLVLGGLRDADPVRRRWAWAATFGLVYYALHNVLDFYANMPAALLAAALPVAYLDATSPRSIPLPGLGSLTRVAGRLAVAGLTIAVVGSVLILGRAEQVAADARDATTAANETGWIAALAPAQAAVTADPDLPPYQAVAGFGRTFTGDWPGAMPRLEAAAMVDDLPQTWLAIAAARLQVGDEVGARTALAAALRVGIQQPAVAYAAGTLFERMDDPESADDAFVEALAAVPSLAGDPSWATSPQWILRFRILLERAIAETPGNAWELSLVSGDAVRASSLTHLAVDPELAELVIPAWGRDAAAIEAVQAEAEAHPLDLLRLAWAARVSAHAGDKAQADRFREWAEYVNGGAGAAGFETRVSTNPADPRATTGYSARFYGHYTYRRPTPWDLLPAGVPRLVLEDEAAAS
jgi:O-antigen ligase